MVKRAPWAEKVERTAMPPVAHRCPGTSDDGLRSKRRSHDFAPSKIILGDLFIGEYWRDFSRPLAGLVLFPVCDPPLTWWATFIRPPEADSLPENETPDPSKTCLLGTRADEEQKQVPRLRSVKNHLSQMTVL